MPPRSPRPTGGHRLISADLPNARVPFTDREGRNRSDMHSHPPGNDVLGFNIQVPQPQAFTRTCIGVSQQGPISKGRPRTEPGAESTNTTQQASLLTPWTQNLPDRTLAPGHKQGLHFNMSVFSLDPTFCRRPTPPGPWPRGAPTPRSGWGDGTLPAGRVLAGLPLLPPNTPSGRASADHHHPPRLPHTRPTFLGETDNLAHLYPLVPSAGARLRNAHLIDSDISQSLSSMI